MSMEILSSESRLNCKKHVSNALSSLETLNSNLTNFNNKISSISAFVQTAKSKVKEVYESTIELDNKLGQDIVAYVDGAFQSFTCSDYITLLMSYGSKEDINEFILYMQGQMNSTSNDNETKYVKFGNQVVALKPMTDEEKLKLHDLLAIENENANNETEPQEELSFWQKIGKYLFDADMAKVEQSQREAATIAQTGLLFGEGASKAVENIIDGISGISAENNLSGDRLLLYTDILFIGSQSIGNNAKDEFNSKTVVSDKDMREAMQPIFNALGIDENSEYYDQFFKERNNSENEAFSNATLDIPSAAQGMTLEDIEIAILHYMYEEGYEINGEKTSSLDIIKQNPMQAYQLEQTFTTEFEVSEKTFGVIVERYPELLPVVYASAGKTIAATYGLSNDEIHTMFNSEASSLKEVTVSNEQSPYYGQTLEQAGNSLIGELKSSNNTIGGINLSTRKEGTTQKSGSTLLNDSELEVFREELDKIAVDHVGEWFEGEIYDKVTPWNTNQTYGEYLNEKSLISKNDVFGQAIYQVGMMAPNILLSSIPVVGNVAGSGAIFLNSYGGALEENINTIKSENPELWESDIGEAYNRINSAATTQGLMELGLEKGLGSAIGGFNVKGTKITSYDQLIETVAKNSPGLLGDAIKFVGGIGGELSEEVISLYVTPLILKQTLLPEESLNNLYSKYASKDALINTLTVTALSSGMLQTASYGNQRDNSRVKLDSTQQLYSAMPLPVKMAVSDADKSISQAYTSNGLEGVSTLVSEKLSPDVTEETIATVNPAENSNTQINVDGDTVFQNQKTETENLQEMEVADLTIDEVVPDLTGITEQLEQIKVVTPKNQDNHSTDADKKIQIRKNLLNEQLLETIKSGFNLVKTSVLSKAKDVVAKFDKDTYSRYNDFVKKYQIKPYYFIFDKKYDNLINNRYERNKLNIINKLMQYDSLQAQKILDFAVLSQHGSSYLRNYDNYSLLLNEKIVEIFNLKNNYVNQRNVEYIMSDEKILEAYMLFRDVVSVEKIIELSKHLDIELIKRLSKSSNINNLTFNDFKLIKELKKEILTNEFLDEFVSNSQFRKFMHDSRKYQVKDLTILLKEFNGNFDIERMSNILNLCYKTGLIESAANKSYENVVLTLMCNNERFYQIMSKLNTDERFEYQLRYYENLTDEDFKYVIEEITNNINNLKGLKEIYQIFFPYEIGSAKSLLESVDYNQITDDRIKFYYDATKTIMESKNINFIKKAILSLNKQSITERNQYVHKFLAKYSVDIALKGVKSIEDIKSQKRITIDYDGQSIDFYTYNGDDFRFIVHSIFPWSEFQHYTDPKGSHKFFRAQNLPSHPELWIDSSGDYVSETLSLSTIDNHNTNLFGDYLKYVRAPVLGFNPISDEQIYIISYGDAGSGTVLETSEVKRLDKIISVPGAKKFTDILRPAYNELLTSRYLPNGETRKPDFIISTYPPHDLVNNENNLEWAAYYNIPIIYVDISSYISKYNSEVDTLINELKQSDTVVNTEFIKELTEPLRGYESFSFDDAISHNRDKLASALYSSIMKIFENPNQQNAENLLRELSIDDTYKVYQILFDTGYNHGNDQACLLDILEKYIMSTDAKHLNEIQSNLTRAREIAESILKQHENIHRLNESTVDELIDEELENNSLNSPLIDIEDGIKAYSGYTEYDSNFDEKLEKGITLTRQGIVNGQNNILARINTNYIINKVNSYINGFINKKGRSLPKSLQNNKLALTQLINNELFTSLPRKKQISILKQFSTSVLNNIDVLKLFPELTVHNSELINLNKDNLDLALAILRSYNISELQKIQLIADFNENVVENTMLQELLITQFQGFGVDVEIPNNLKNSKNFAQLLLQSNEVYSGKKSMLFRTFNKELQKQLVTEGNMAAINYADSDILFSRIDNKSAIEIALENNPILLEMILSSTDFSDFFKGNIKSHLSDEILLNPKIIQLLIERPTILKLLNTVPYILQNNFNLAKSMLNSDQLSYFDKTSLFSKFSEDIQIQLIMEGNIFAVSHADVDLLKMEMEDSKTLLENSLENNPNLLEQIWNSPDIYPIAKKNFILEFGYKPSIKYKIANIIAQNPQYLFVFNELPLFLRNDYNLALSVLSSEKINLYDKKKFFSNFSKNIQKQLILEGNIEAISYANQEVLEQKIGDKTLLETVLEQNPDLLQVIMSSEQFSILIFSKLNENLKKQLVLEGNINAVSLASPELLKQKTDGKTLIQIALEQNPDLMNINIPSMVIDEEIFKIYSQYGKISINKKQVSQIYSDYISIMNNGTSSDQGLVLLLGNSLLNSIMNGNLQSLFILKNLVELKKNNPDLHIKLDTETNECFWYEAIQEISIGTLHSKWQDSGAIKHELGHLLFDLILNGELPNNWRNIVSNARIWSSHKGGNVFLNRIQELFKEINSNAYDSAYKNFEQQVKSWGFMSVNEYRHALIRKYKNYELDELDNIKEYLKLAGYKSDTITAISGGGYKAEEFADISIKSFIAIEKERILRMSYSEYLAISDIIDAVFKGTGKDLNNYSLYFVGMHGEEYYNTGLDNLPFHEIIANFTKLKISNNDEILEWIRLIFGDEFYNCLNNTYNKFIAINSNNSSPRNHFNVNSSNVEIITLEE